MLTRLTHASYYIDGQPIFDDIEMTINEYDRVALIGRNGCGKSTLLNILSGQIEINSGTFDVKKDTRILLVKQELPPDDKTPIEYLKESDAELTRLYELFDQENSDVSKISDEICQLESERYEEQAILVLIGLGLSKEKQDKPMRELSGGLRMRVALASALLQYPDVLLLDEPTNHLDLQAITWLTEFLKTYPKPFVMVSHDRKLLSSVINKTYHLQQGALTCYNGDFNTFLEQYHLAKEQAIKTNINTDKKIEKMQEFVNKFKAKPKWARIAKTREGWIDNLEKNRPDIVSEEPIIPIEFPECEVLKDPIFSVKTGSVAYDTTIVLSKLNFSVQANSRIGILGCNGQGKSTFVRMIMNHLVKVTGDIYSSPKLRIGYFSQEQSDILDKDLTVMEQFKTVSNNSQEEIFNQLLYFGFDRNKCTCQIDSLSGGEKTRLLLAMIAAKKPHLIIMDEPTNHLDFETKQTLIAAIQKFNGAVILVSHDWELLETTMKDFWIVAKGKMMPYPKGLDHYRTAILTHFASLSAHTTTDVVKQMQGLSLIPHHKEADTMKHASQKDKGKSPCPENDHRKKYAKK